MAGTWELLGSASGGSGTMSVSFTTGQENLFVQFQQGTNVQAKIQYNDDDGSNQYSFRRDEDGTEQSVETTTYIRNWNSGSATQRMTVMQIANQQTKKKEAIHRVFETTSGADEIGNRMSGVSEWNNTTAKINKISFTALSGSFDSSDSMTVWGATGDVNEMDNLTNVPANTRYEETDTRKIYRRTAGTQSYNSTTTNVTLSNSNLTATSTSTAWGNRAYSTVSYNPTNIPSGETREFKFTMGDITKNGFMGFDSTPTTISGHGNDNNASGVDYGMYLVGNGSSNNYLEVSEQGTNKYQSSSNFITSNTIFKITVDSSGVVKYYADATDGTTLLYTSLTAMSGDFYVLFYPYDNGFTTTITSWSNNPEWKERNTV